MWGDSYFSEDSDNFDGYDDQDDQDNKKVVRIKRGLRTGYKPWTGYKTRTTDFVYKNSFRKVTLREMDSRLA